MYSVDKYVIHKDDALYSYFLQMTAQAKLLTNASLYRLRQHYTSFRKEKSELQPNQQEVENEIALTVENSNFDTPYRVMSYYFLDRLMRVTENPDYFNILPMQASQQIVKKCCREFKAFTHALKEYKKCPEKFTGRPKMPKYRKFDYAELIFSNQDCRIHTSGDGRLVLKFSKTKEVLALRNRAGRLKEVKIKPWSNIFIVSVTVEDSNSYTAVAGSHIASIDLGVDNLAAFVSNDGKPSILYKGEYIKSINQWYNKRHAELVSQITAGSVSIKYVHSAKLSALSVKRSMKLRDIFHKVSNDIIHTCIQRGISTLVIGHNQQWKTGANMGKRNNQNFVQIPFATLIYMLTYKAERSGIQIVLQEESYTSKASYLDRDEIPTYQKDDKTKYHFSGRRFQRGLYRSSDGSIVNADLNGAANIMRKAFPSETENVNLMEIKTTGFRDLYPAV